MPTPTLTIEQHDQEVIDNINEQDQEILDAYSSLFIPPDYDAFIELSGIKPDGGKYTMTYPHKISPYLLLCHLQLLDDGKGNNISNLNARAYTCQIPVNNKKTGKLEPRGYYFEPKPYEVFKLGTQLSDKKGMTKTVMFDFDAHRLYELAKVSLPFAYTERELLALLKDVPEDQQKAKRYELIEERKLEILKAKEAAQPKIQPYLDADASKLCELLEKDGLTPYIEPSTRGGLHVWALFEEAVSVAKLKAYADQLAKSLDGQLNQFFEVYPKSGNEQSNRAFLPLEFITRDGVILHLNDLDDLREIELSNPDVIQAITVKAKKTKAKKSDNKDTKTGRVTLTNNPDLLDTEQMFETLKASALNAPDSFERHHAIPAFLNLAERIGKKEEMLDFLQGEAVHKAWGLAQDASRSLNQWADEVEAWAEQDPPVNESGEAMQRGIPYLTEQGFDLSEFSPQLKELEQDQRQVIVNKRHHNEIADELVSKIQTLNLKGQPIIFERGQGLMVEMLEGFTLSAEITQTSKLKAFLHEQFLAVVEKTAVDKETNEPYTYYEPASFSENQVNLILRKTGQFPAIKHVSEIPLVLKSGEVLLEPGYHASEGYYLNTQGIEIDESMTMLEARDLLLEAFNEFSYKDAKTGFTATLAAVIQPFVMPVIDDITPMYTILGARRSGSGAGKGFLLDCIYRIHKGKGYMPNSSMPSKDEEMAKRLFAALSEGSSHFIIDEAEEIMHRSLMMAITTKVFRDRILGQSKTFEVSTQVTWLLSANAPIIHTDFYRRMIPIPLTNLNYGEDSSAGFSNPNINHEILENRNKYLSAVMAIIRHWINLGMPESKNTLKGFHRWSAIMGGILEAIGLPYLLDGREKYLENKQHEKNDLDALIDYWIEYRVEEKQKAKDLSQIAQKLNLFKDIIGNQQSENQLTAEIGKLLSRYEDDIFSGYFLRRNYDSHEKVFVYNLEKLPEKRLTVKEQLNFSPLLDPRNPRKEEDQTAKKPKNHLLKTHATPAAGVAEVKKRSFFEDLPIQADEPLSYEQLNSSLPKSGEL